MRLKPFFILFVTAVIVISTSLPGRAQNAPRDPEIVKEQFKTVASRLDAGGDLLVVANIEGLLKAYIDQIVQLSSLGFAAAASAGGAPPIDNPFERISPFLDKSGLYAVEGFGMSLVPREDGLNDAKTFLSRDATAAGRPLWRALVGFKPFRPTSLDYIPRDAVLAQTSTGEPAQLWKLIRQGIREVGTPEMAQGFEASLDMMAGELGVSMDDLFRSMKGDSFLSIQLSESEEITIPMGMPGMEMKLDLPSLLIGVVVENDSLVTALEHQMTKKNMPVVKSTVNGVVLRSVNLPIPSPIPLQLTFTSHAGMFLFGTTPDSVKSALSSAKKKNGLVTTAHYKEMFDDLPMENNGMSYMSPRLGRLITEIQTKSMQGAQGMPGMPPVGLMRNMMGAGGDQTSASITLNRKSGIATRGVTSTGIKDMGSSMAMAPMGMMAAIAIPSFIKARTTSQHHSCVNNLRILDAAKEQWAMEKNKSDGDAVEMKGMLNYVRDRVMPKCAQGGTYSINSIGDPPTCSEPKHSLR
jgi:hypothetical protein